MRVPEGCVSSEYLITCSSLKVGCIRLIDQLLVESMYICLAWVKFSALDWVRMNYTWFNFLVFFMWITLELDRLDLLLSFMNLLVFWAMRVFQCLQEKEQG